MPKIFFSQSKVNQTFYTFWILFQKVNVVIETHNSPTKSDSLGDSSASFDLYEKLDEHGVTPITVHVTDSFRNSPKRESG